MPPKLGFSSRAGQGGGERGDAGRRGSMGGTRQPLLTAGIGVGPEAGTFGSREEIPLELPPKSGVVKFLGSIGILDNPEYIFQKAKKSPEIQVDRLFPLNFHSLSRLFTALFFVAFAVLTLNLVNEANKNYSRFFSEAGYDDDFNRAWIDKWGWLENLVRSFFAVLTGGLTALQESSPALTIAVGSLFVSQAVYPTSYIIRHYQLNRISGNQGIFYYQIPDRFFSVPAIMLLGFYLNKAVKKLQQANSFDTIIDDCEATLDTMDSLSALELGPFTNHDEVFFCALDKLGDIYSEAFLKAANPNFLKAALSLFGIDLIGLPMLRFLFSCWRQDRHILPATAFLSEAQLLRLVESSKKPTTNPLLDPAILAQHAAAAATIATSRFRRGSASAKAGGVGLEDTTSTTGRPLATALSGDHAGTGVAAGGAEEAGRGGDASALALSSGVASRLAAKPTPPPRGTSSRVLSDLHREPAEGKEGTAAAAGGAGEAGRGGSASASALPSGSSSASRLAAKPTSPPRGTSGAPLVKTGAVTSPSGSALRLTGGNLGNLREQRGGHVATSGEGASLTRAVSSVMVLSPSISVQNLVVAGSGGPTDAAVSATDTGALASTAAPSGEGLFTPRRPSRVSTGAPAAAGSANQGTPLSTFSHSDEEDDAGRARREFTADQDAQAKPADHPRRSATAKSIPRGSRVTPARADVLSPDTPGSQGVPGDAAIAEPAAEGTGGGVRLVDPPSARSGLAALRSSLQSQNSGGTLAFHLGASICSVLVPSTDSAASGEDGAHDDTVAVDLVSTVRTDEKAQPPAASSAAALPQRTSALGVGGRPPLKEVPTGVLTRANSAASLPTARAALGILSDTGRNVGQFGFSRLPLARAAAGPPAVPTGLVASRTTLYGGGAQAARTAAHLPTRAGSFS